MYLVPGFWNDVSVDEFFVDLETQTVIKWNGFKLIPLRGDRITFTDDEGREHKVNAQTVIQSTLAHLVDYLFSEGHIAPMSELGLVPESVRSAVPAQRVSKAYTGPSKPAVHKEEPQEPKKVFKLREEPEEVEVPEEHRFGRRKEAEVETPRKDEWQERLDSIKEDLGVSEDVPARDQEDDEDLNRVADLLLQGQNPADHGYVIGEDDLWRKAE